jgi:hypothetical protein
MQKVAFAVSVVFHPVFLFFYVLLLTLLLLPGGIAGSGITPLLILSVFVLLNTIIFPLAGTYLLTGGILLNNLSHRTRAYLLTAFFYTLSYFFLLRTPVYEFLKAYNLSIVVVLIILAMLSLRWKISMHTTAMGGLVALFAHMYYQMPHLFLIPMIVSVLIAGLVGSARLKLDAHTNIEVYAGYMTGFTITGFVMGFILAQ